MTDWIKWSGGECPVPPDTRVSVLFRNGDSEFRCVAGQWTWKWMELKAPYDIVGYRVVPQNPVPDLVNSPPHYTDGGIEAIDFIRAKLGPDGFRSYCVGNALKYISRAGKKGDAGEDLRKAKVYLERAIND